MPVLNRQSAIGNRLSFPFTRKPSLPAPPCQPQVALASFGVVGQLIFGRSGDPLC
jgi:hypothetical protein